MDGAIVELGRRALRAALDAGEVSCLEVAEAFIVAAERINPVLNALVHFDPEFVRAEVERFADGIAAPTGPGSPPAGLVLKWVCK